MDYRIMGHEVDAKFTTRRTWTIPREAARRERRPAPEQAPCSVPRDRSAIFAASADYAGSGNGGQLRTDELFRRVAFRQTPEARPKGSLVDRTTVLTVAWQEDGPKRARDARLPQRPGGEGIVVLGHLREHRAMAEALGIPAPRRGSWVAAHLTAPSDDDPRPSIAIGEQDYVLAEEAEPAANISGTY